MKIFDVNTVYKRLVENMNEAVWMGDADERTIYANPKFCALVGYSLDEIIGKLSYEFWDEESAEKVRRVNMTDRKRGISSSYEGNLVTKTRKKIPVFLNGTPLPDGGTIGIMTDLTEIRKRESLYKRLVEHMNEAVWMGDANERTLYANPKFCNLLGYSLEEILGHPSYDFWDSESATRVRKVNTVERKKGISSSYEGDLVTKDGKKIPVLLSGTPLADGGTIGIMTDLTQLKKSAEAEHVLEHAIQNANDAIIILDSNGMIQSWNKGAKVVFGYRKEETIGKGIGILFSADDTEVMLGRPRTRYSDQVEGRHKNGQSVRIAATITPVPPEHRKSKARFRLLFARDITSQMKFEEEIALRYQKLRDAYNRFGITRRQMDYLFDLLHVCATATTMKQVADFIVSSVIMLTRVDACVLRLFNPSRQTLDLLSSFGLTDDWRGKSHIKLKGSLAERAFDSKSPLKIIDLSQEVRYHSPHLAKKHNLLSLLLIPLIYQETLIGSLSLYVSPAKKLELFENEFIERYASLVTLTLVRSSPAAIPHGKEVR